MSKYGLQNGYVAAEDVRTPREIVSYLCSGINSHCDKCRLCAYGVRWVDDFSMSFDSEQKPVTKKYSVERHRALREKRIANRLCSRCGKKLTADDVFTTCAVCREKERIRKRRLALNG